MKFDYNFYFDIISKGQNFFRIDTFRIWPLITKQMFSDGEGFIEELGENIKTLEKQRDEELGGRLTELECNLKEKEKDNLKAETNLKTVKDNKKQEEKKMTQIQKGMNTVRHQR